VSTGEIEMSQLEDIAKALRQIATQIEELSAPAKAAPATPQIAPGTVITLEDVRAALTKLASAKGATYVKALLGDHHAKKLSDLAPASYAVVLLAAEKELGND
jgi:hypothetical protein